jgi:hypothetical protein
MGNRLNNKYNNSEHVIEQISAYLDGALEDELSNEVRAHIDGCTECHAEYIEVRATRQLLRNVPAVQPLRAFTLTPEMVQRKVWLWERLLVPRNVPRLATGSVMTFALVLLLIMGNVGGIASNDTAQMINTLEKRSSAQLPVSAPELAPTAPTDQFYMAIGTPQAQAQRPLVLATTGAEMDSGVAQSTPSAMAAGRGMNEVSPTYAVPSTGGGDALIPATPHASGLTRPGGFTPGLQEADLPPAIMGDTATNQQPTDGLQVLIFSIEGLLVALGAAFAVGAVVAARR